MRNGEMRTHLPSASENAQSLTLDDALEMIPTRQYQYRMLLLCGLAFMSDALEVNLLSYLSTCAASTFGLGIEQEASLSSAVFVGMVVGASWLGALAHSKGRKTAFLASCSLISIGGFLTAAAPSYAWLLVIRWLVGMGVGGTSIAFDILAEFMPASHRGVFLICIQFFWTFGSMYVNGMAWAFLDSNGWRVLAIIAAIPVTVTSILCIVLMPESPRWLLSKGRYEEAEAIVREAARVNGLVMPPFRLVYEEEVHESTDYRQLVADPAIRKITFPLWVVWAMFGFTYYGIILYTSRLYDNSDNDDGSNDDDQCSFDYSALFINSASELAGCAFGAILLDFMGRSRMQTSFYVISGVASLFMGFGGINSTTLLVLSVMGRMAVMCASNATWVATPELYNTELRTVGHSLCICWSKFGSFLCPFVVVSRASPASVSALLFVANLLAAVASWMLPDTTGVDIGKAVGKSGHRHVDGHDKEDKQLLAMTLRSHSRL